MAIVTIEEVFKHVELFEQMLADFYAELSEKSSHEGVRMLTDYMSRHRKRINKALEKLSHEQIQRICSVPLKYESHVPDCRCFDKIQLPENPSAPEILDAAVILDECLVDIYQQVLQQPVDEEIRSLFESFVRAEKRDEIEMKKIKAMDYF